MDNPDTPYSRGAHQWITILRIVLLYVLVPVLLLILLARPISSAVCRADSAAFLILLAAAATVGANWYIYTLIHRRRPPLPVFAHGVFCVLSVSFIAHDALPPSYALTSTMAFISGFLVLLLLLILSFWLASLRSRPAHAIAVGLRIVVGIALFFMAYQIVRDIESRNVTGDTWITAGILVAILLARNSPRIYYAVRGAIARRRASELAEGRIVQILGETHFDLDGDPVTLSHARVEYTVDDVVYEARADISRYTIRKFRKAAFIGKEIPVSYNPKRPSEAFVNRIDRHFLDAFAEEEKEESGEETEDQPEETESRT